MKEYLITLVIVVVGVILAGYVQDMLKSKTA
jgi:carbon starvation protein CstA